MQSQVFQKWIHALFCAFPGSLKNGHVPVDVQQVYWEVLKDQDERDVAKAFEKLSKTHGNFVPSAATILAMVKKFETDRHPSHYHNEWTQEPDPQAQLPAYAGDGLPQSSRDIPPAPGRKDSHYSEESHQATDYYLDMIRAMKIKKMDGGEMATKIMQEMSRAGVKRPVPQGPYADKVRAGHIPKAAGPTCAAFADMLDETAMGRGPTGDPTEIGGRLFWTFSAQQQTVIRQQLARARGQGR